MKRICTIRVAAVFEVEMGEADLEYWQKSDNTQQNQYLADRLQLPSDQADVKFKNLDYNPYGSWLSEVAE